MDSTILLIHGDREEDLKLRTALQGAAPGLGLSIARNPDEVRFYPVPEVILLDLDLWKPSALDMLEWLRSGEPYEQIPVIVLSSTKKASFVNRAIELGATSCLLKCGDGDLLDGVVRGIGVYARFLANR